MTNGKPPKLFPNLATLIGPVFPPDGGKLKKPLGLKVVSTPEKVTLLFNQPVADLALKPDSARKLAETIVKAADAAEREKDGPSSDSEGSGDGPDSERKDPEDSSGDA